MGEFLLPLIGELRLNLVLKPKKMSWGEHKTQSPLDGSDVLTHKQDNSKSRRGRERKQSSGDGRGNVHYCVTEL